MTLTHTEVKNAKPKAKPYKMSGKGGLFLSVQPNGSKWWRFKYRIDGREKSISLGIFPDVGVQEAHKRRDEARKLVAADIDPSAKHKAAKAVKLARTDGADTFEVTDIRNGFVSALADAFRKIIPKELPYDSR